MVTIERAPASAAPAATSSATFSLTDHSTWMLPGLPADTVGKISEDGVPG